MEATKPEIGRILCATDLSDKSANTYRYAIQKAHFYGFDEKGKAVLPDRGIDHALASNL